MINVHYRKDEHNETPLWKDTIQSLYTEFVIFSMLSMRPNKNKTPVDRPGFFQKVEDEGLFIFNFYFSSKMAAKHLNSKWPTAFYL